MDNRSGFPLNNLLDQKKRIFTEQIRNTSETPIKFPEKVDLPQTLRKLLRTYLGVHRNPLLSKISFDEISGHRDLYCNISGHRDLLHNNVMLSEDCGDPTNISFDDISGHQDLLQCTTAPCSQRIVVTLKKF